MGNKNNRGPAPSTKTINILIARAGGRCQFENCNKNVFLDEFTLDDTNDSNIAHIIASSPDGPRGDKDQSFIQSDKIENLMLMCLDHHHLIDEKGKERIYTVEKLRSMKRAQEESVKKMMDNLNADVTTMIYFSSPIKGIQSNSFSAREAAKAFLPRMKVNSEFEMRISLQCSEKYESAKYWQDMECQLEYNFNCTVRSKLNISPNVHFSIFPIAPIPLIMKFGFLLGDKVRADVYQKTRQPETWEWQSKELTNTFFIEKQQFEEGTEVAVVVSITAEIEIDAVQKAGAFKTIYILRAENQNDDCIKSEKDLSDFWHKYKELFEMLKGEEKVSVFPSIPVSAAFEMGRRYMVGIYPKMIVYDRNDDFFETLTIGARND